MTSVNPALGDAASNPRYRVLPPYILQDDTGVSYKRHRNGALHTGYFNRIGLPGVRGFDAQTHADLGERAPWSRQQIHFDGDATQLFYPPDSFLIRDGVVYLRGENKNGTPSYRKVGALDFANEGNGDGTGIPIFQSVEPSKTSLEIKETADRALEALQYEVDLYTRRFYVFAGGDFGPARSMYTQFFQCQRVDDFYAVNNFPAADYNEMYGTSSSKRPFARGRWGGLYGRVYDVDLNNVNYGVMWFQNGIRDTSTGAVSSSGSDPAAKMDLSNNRKVHIVMRVINPDSDEYGSEAIVNFQVGNGYAGDSCNYTVPFQAQPDVGDTQGSNVAKGWFSRFEFTIPDNVDLSSVGHFLKVELNQADGESGDGVNMADTKYRLFITDVWFDWTGPTGVADARLFDKCWVKSWDTPEPDLHFSIILQNTCFTYDQTLAMYALLGAGDVFRATLLARALEYVVGNDLEYNDDRVRDAYRCGPAEPIPTDYAVSLPGWYGRKGWRTKEAKDEDKTEYYVDAGNLDEYSQDAYAVSTWTGTAGWVIMALMSFHRYAATALDPEWRAYVNDAFPELGNKPGSLFLDKAKRLAEWVVERFKVTTDYLKGYMGGFYGFSTVDYSEGAEGAPRVPKGVYGPGDTQYSGPGQFVLPWRSVEHAADLYAGFRHLYEVTGDSFWGDEMRHALEYIDKHWYDGPFDEYGNVSLYWTGTGEIDEDLWNAPINRANLPTDPTVWITYGTDRLDAMRLRSLNWFHHNARQKGGDPNSMWKYSVASTAGWIEGAGQVSILFRAYGLTSWWQAALSPCVDNQLPDSHLMYSVTETASTGFNLPNVGLQDRPWKYFRQGHMGATSWFLMGWEQINPFKFPVDFMGGGQPAVDARFEAEFLRNVTVRHNLDVDNELVVDGAASLKDTLDVENKTSLKDTLDVKNGVTVDKGGLTINEGGADVTGPLRLAPADGNPYVPDVLQALMKVENAIDNMIEYKRLSQHAPGDHSPASDFLANNDPSNDDNKSLSVDIQGELWDPQKYYGVPADDSRENYLGVFRIGDFLQVYFEAWFKDLSNTQYVVFDLPCFSEIWGVNATPQGARRQSFDAASDTSTNNVMVWPGNADGSRNTDQWNSITVFANGGLEHPIGVTVFGRRTKSSDYTAGFTFVDSDPQVSLTTTS